MFDKIKEILADDSIFYSILLILIGVVSFGLGRMTILADQTEATAVVIDSSKAEETVDPQVVVSKNGTKYHYLWCPGASQMKEENKLFFPNEEAAIEAGYEPASNCEF